MNQNEKRVYLIETLLKERRKYTRMQIPANVEEQKRLLRSLMNIRMPGAIDDEFLRVQDEYLQQINKEKGIVTLSVMKYPFSVSLTSPRRYVSRRIFKNFITKHTDKICQV